MPTVGMPLNGFAEPGVLRLIQKLDTANVRSPENIPMRILVDALEEVVPTLTRKFQTSYDTATVPEDKKLQEYIL